jgi:hypothetical protein
VAQGHDYESQVEHPQAAHLPEEEEATTQYQQADEDHAPSPQAVSKIALDWAHDAAFYPS